MNQAWCYATHANTLSSNTIATSAAKGYPCATFRLAMLKWFRIGGSNSVVESQPSKLLVAGPIPVSRSIFQQLSKTHAICHSMSLH